MKIFSTILIAFLFSSNAFAEGKGKGGDEFRKTASEYQEMAKKYGDKGNYEVAALYQRMAEIKLQAAAKGDVGDWDSIDWTEYEKISTEVEQLKSKDSYSKKYKK